VGCCLQTC